MPDIDPRDRYLVVAVKTERALRVALDTAREAGIDDWLADLDAQIAFITEAAEAVRGGEVEVTVTAIDWLEETATFADRIEETSTREETVALTDGLMRQVSAAMASCVYVCEDGVHEWPCGVPGRPRRCLDDKRWIQQVR